MFNPSIQVSVYHFAPPHIQKRVSFHLRRPSMSEGDVEVLIPLWVLAGYHVLVVVAALVGPLITAISVMNLLRIGVDDSGEGGADCCGQAAKVL